MKPGPSYWANERPMGEPNNLKRRILSKTQFTAQPIISPLEVLTFQYLFIMLIVALLLILNFTFWQVIISAWTSTFAFSKDAYV